MGAINFNHAAAGGAVTVSADGTTLLANGVGLVRNGQTVTNATNAANLFGGDLYNTREIATLSNLQANTLVNYDLLTQSVLFYTLSATGNWSINFRGNAGSTLNANLAVGRSMNAVFLVLQGSPAYYNTAVQIDGTTAGVTTRWQGGSAPTAGNANSVDVYNYTIIKSTASPQYLVFASLTRFA